MKEWERYFISGVCKSVPGKLLQVARLIGLKILKMAETTLIHALMVILAHMSNVFLCSVHTSFNNFINL